MTSKNELLAAIDETVLQVVAAVSALDDTTINTVPYEGSWTAGQVVRHIIISTNGMANVMLITSAPATRAADEKADWLKKIFLDLSNKMNSPDFIVPEAGPYQKEASIESLNNIFRQFKENTSKADMADMVDNLPFSPVTKLEVVHFVLYHTQRHLQQLINICTAIR